MVGPAQTQTAVGHRPFWQEHPLGNPIFNSRIELRACKPAGTREDYPIIYSPLNE